MVKRCVSLIKVLYLLYYISSRKLKINLNKRSHLKIQFISIIIYNLLIKYLSAILLKSNSIYLFLNNNKNFIKLLTILKGLFSLNFSQLLDIVIVDRLEIKSFEIKRFSYLYVLLSIFLNFRIFICGFLFLFEILPSIMNFFKSAD